MGRASALKRTVAPDRKVAQQEFNNWYDSRWHRIRLWIASKILGKPGWRVFHAAYYRVRMEAELRNIKASIPDTWDEAASMIPGWIEVLDID